MIEVRTASRLHFGLLNVSAHGAWKNLLGEPVIPERQFGGAGLMIERPEIEIKLEASGAWSAEGPLASRALHYAQRLAATVASEVIPQRISVNRAPREHIGLGVGTQLGLAVAHGLANAWNLELDNRELARRVGRGERSALGIHGFTQGGFLVEAGKTSAEAIAPLVSRVQFPDDWRIILVIPSGAVGSHGPDESDAFASLDTSPSNTTESLCRLVLLGLLPSLIERDFDAFSESLYDLNARVGEVFSSIQGGRYAHPLGDSVITFFRNKGVRGVGQSSWGPTLFALIRDEEEAGRWRGRLGKRFSLDADEVLVTRASNSGAELRCGASTLAGRVKSLK
jgi:beta-RFAP synthase